MSQIEKVSDLIKGGLESIASRWMPTPNYDAYTTHKGRLVVDVNEGEDRVRIGNVADQPFFNKGSFTPSQLAVIDDFEDYNQQVHLASGPRTNSGMHPYDHIVNVVRGVYENAQIAGVPVTLPDVLTPIGHDVIENREKIIRYTRTLKKVAIKTFNVKPDQTSHLAEERRRLAKELAKERVIGKEEIKRRFKRFIEESGDYSLSIDTNTSVRGIAGLTRESDEVPFPLSMGQQLGKGNLEDVLHKAIAKFADRDANMVEVRPLHSPSTMKQIDLAFRDERAVNEYVIEKYLTGRFGGVSLMAQPMTPSQQVHNAFNSFFVFHYFNERINRYLESIAGGQYKIDRELLKVALFPFHYPTEEISPDLRARLLNPKNRKMQLMRLAMVSRDTTIDTTLELLMSAVSQYETKHDLGSHRDEIERNIQVLKVTSDFYDRVDLDGAVREFLYYDALGRDRIAQLDQKPQQRLFIYEAALNMMESFQRLKMYRNPSRMAENGKPALSNDPIAFEPGKTPLFTMEKMSSILDLMPSYWEMVAHMNTPRYGRDYRGNTRVALWNL